MDKKRNDKDKEETTERYYNSKTMVVALGTVGVGAYILGTKRGIKKGYMEGLKDGIVQGLANGSLEGYVKGIADVASVMRSTES